MRRKREGAAGWSASGPRSQRVKQEGGGGMSGRFAAAGALRAGTARGPTASTRKERHASSCGSGAVSSMPRWGREHFGGMIRGRCPQGRTLPRLIFCGVPPGRGVGGIHLPTVAFWGVNAVVRPRPEPHRDSRFRKSDLAADLQFPVASERPRFLAANRSTTVSIGAAPDANFSC